MSASLIFMGDFVVICFCFVFCLFFHFLSVCAPSYKSKQSRRTSDNQQNYYTHTMLSPLPIGKNSAKRQQWHQPYAAFPPINDGDLIAYEYLDPVSDGWRCELGVVLGGTEERTIRVERLVQTTSVADFYTAPKTEEGKLLLRQLNELQKELVKCVVDSDIYFKKMCEKRSGYIKKCRKLEETVFVTRKAFGEACEAVSKIDDRHWSEILSYRTPPEIVVRVVAAAMLILGERPSTWERMTSVLRKRKLTQELPTHDLSILSNSCRDELMEQYINTPGFTYEEALKDGMVTADLYQWVVSYVSAAEANKLHKAIEQMHQSQIIALEEMEAKAQVKKDNVAVVVHYIERLWKQYDDVEGKAEFASSFFPLTFCSDSEPDLDSKRLGAGAIPSTSLTGVGALLQLIVRPWQATKNCELAIILASSVLTSFGPSPPISVGIRLNRQQYYQLLEATQLRGCSVNSARTQETFSKDCGETDSSTQHHSQITRHPFSYDTYEDDSTPEYCFLEGNTKVTQFEHHSHASAWTEGFVHSKVVTDSASGEPRDAHYPLSSIVTHRPATTHSIIKQKREHDTQNPTIFHPHIMQQLLLSQPESVDGKLKEATAQQHYLPSGVDVFSVWHVLPLGLKTFFNFHINTQPGEIADFLSRQEFFTPMKGKTVFFQPVKTLVACEYSAPVQEGVDGRAPGLLERTALLCVGSILMAFALGSSFYKQYAYQ